MLAGALLRAGPILDDPWAVEHALLTLQPDPAGKPRAGRRASHAGRTARPAGRPGAGGAGCHRCLGGDRRPGWLEWAEPSWTRVWRDYLDDQTGRAVRHRPRRWRRACCRPEPSRCRMPRRPLPTALPPSSLPGWPSMAPESRLGGASRRPGDARLPGRPGSSVFTAPRLLLGIDWLLNPPAHLVVVGADGDAEADRMHALALAACFPRRVVQRLRRRRRDVTGCHRPLGAMLAPARDRAAYLCVGTGLPAGPRTSAAAVAGDAGGAGVSGERRESR